jgi:hypothetical protein
MEKPVLRTEKIYPVGRMPVKTQPNPGKALQNKRSAPCVLSLEANMKAFADLLDRLVLTPSRASARSLPA